jgi:hypothetical protein
VDVTGYLTVRKKELQGKDKLTAEIADSDKAFKVNLRLSVKLKVRACSLGFTKNEQTFGP